MVGRPNVQPAGATETAKRRRTTRTTVPRGDPVSTRDRIPREHAQSLRRELHSDLRSELRSSLLSSLRSSLRSSQRNSARSSLITHSMMSTILSRGSKLFFSAMSTNTLVFFTRQMVNTLSMCICFSRSSFCKQCWQNHLRLSRMLIGN